MAVNLSPVAGAAAQFFDNSGQVLTGGKLYTYDAGTTTPAVTYTNSSGNTPHSNPIVLNAAGRVPDSGEIWLADGISYKFVLKDQNDVLIGTYDNLSGINSNFVNFTGEEETQTATQGQTVFTLATLNYQPATNNLLVFVNGSKQIEGENYIETSSTVITFIDGLNVGDVVDFCTATPINTNIVDAASVTYNEGGTGAVDQNVQDRLRQYISVKDFGATGDGTTDDTDAINLAYASLSSKGGTIYWPIGEYKTSAAIVVKSNTTTLFSNGAFLNPVALNDFTPLEMPTYTWGYALFQNENWASSSLSDENITYVGVRALPTRGAFTWYGGTAWNGHVISSRNVTNLKIVNGYAENFADYSSTMHCFNVVLADNWATGMSNSTYDFWEGCQGVVIKNNTALNTNNGINWNAVDTQNLGSFSAENCLIDGNTISGGRAAAIYVAPLNTTSACTLINITNNYIDQLDVASATANGITVQSATNVIISGNILNNISTPNLPIVVTKEGTSGIVSTNISITDNIIEGSTLTSTAYIGMFGVDGYVSGNISHNSTAEVGVQVDSPTSVVVNNSLVATYNVVNKTNLGVDTTPAFQITPDKTNGYWYVQNPIKVNGNIGQNTNYGVTAVGTNLATALAITATYTWVSTVASGTGVALPSAVAKQVGSEYVIWNAGANALKVYANTGDSILGSGASVTVSASAKIRLVCITTTAWAVSGT